MNDFKLTFRRLGKDLAFTVVAVLAFMLASVVPSSPRPGNSKLFLGTQTPDCQTSRHDANDRANSFSTGVEGRVTKQPSYKMRRFVLANSQDSQAVPGLTEASPCQTQIACEERWRAKCQQERDDLVVGHALATQLDSDLPDGNAPASQQLALALQNVFIEDVHAPRSYSQLVSVFTERLAGRAHRLGYGFLRDATAPFFDDALPSHSGGNLLQHVGNKDSRASERRLPMANPGISNNVAANHFLSHTDNMNTPSCSASQRGALPDNLPCRVSFTSGGWVPCLLATHAPSYAGRSHPMLAL